MSDLNKLAAALDSYLRFRAEREGVGYGLGIGFFKKLLNRGVRNFFGIHCDGTQILYDDQQPKIFIEWRTLKQ
jgi:hypothetical protein